MKKVNDKFLKSTKYIDFNNSEILAKCESLKEDNQSKEAYAKRAFEFVRDEIQHSIDYKIERVTIKASDALEYKTGVCFAKSHLLAALLRANNIPAGLCYQRLLLKGENPTFSLHGLNAIYLKKYGWFKIDPRGNKINDLGNEIDVQFNPPENSFAFKGENDGEYTDDYIYAEPHDYLIEAMEKSETIDELLENIPDNRPFYKN